MNANSGECRTSGAVTRRVALRGLGGAGLAAALAIGGPTRAGADNGDRVANAWFGLIPAPNPKAVIAAYATAVNAGDLEGILALYADDAVHVALPSADGSAGVCLGKAQFRMWYEQSVANGDRITVEDDTVAVDGNRATFALRVSSDPWRALGLDALEATAEAVLVAGKIVTHMVMLTPTSVRELLSANGAIPATTSAALQRGRAIRVGTR